jgi:hypothetical protein
MSAFSWNSKVAFELEAKEGTGRCPKSGAALLKSVTIAFDGYAFGAIADTGSFWQLPAHHFPRVTMRGLAKPAASKALATSGT